MADIIPDGCV